jgi:hypothetical protein
MDNFCLSDHKEGIKEAGVRIFKFQNNGIVIGIKEAEGPYLSLRNLKKNSLIYRQLLRKNPKKAQEILQETKIHNIKELLFVEDKTYPKDLIKLFTHTIKGNISNKNVFGIHYFNNTFMRIRELINQENSKGVWEAKIDVYDKLNNTWIEKRPTTTFFPKDWNITQLFHECEYACEHKIKVINSENRFSSKTLSGINVVIIIINNIVKSIYPIYD